jgi:hypothetical protein
LAAIVIGYVKQALKEKLIAYAKEKAMGLAGEALADVPGAGMLGMMPGMGGVRADRHHDGQGGGSGPGRNA